MSVHIIIPTRADTPVAFPAPTDRYVHLPLHLFEVKTHRCLYCGDQPLWDSYEEYVDWFYEYEHEGERDHAPEGRDDWEYTSAACLKAELY